MKNKLFINGFIIIYILLSLKLGYCLKKEEKYGWKKEFLLNFNLSQTNLKNWYSGGEDSLNWQIDFTFRLLNNQKNFNLVNLSRIEFGKSKTGKEIRKSLDSIKLESTLKWKGKPLKKPYISFTFETQSAPGYKFLEGKKEKISDFLNPGYFTQSIGLRRNLGDIGDIFLGFAVKETVSKDFPKIYTDDPDTTKVEKVKVEMGLESINNIKLNINKNTLFYSKLRLFSNLKKIEEIDIDWESNLYSKISKYIYISFNLKLIYDFELSKKSQIQQSFGIGINYLYI